MVMKEHADQFDSGPSEVFNCSMLLSDNIFLCGIHWQLEK